MAYTDVLLEQRTVVGLEATDDGTHRFAARSLSRAGPTGFEAAAQDVVRRRLAAARRRPRGDPLGNVWLSVGPEDGPLVAVVAHADQIGLIVTYVDEHGYLSVERIGGVAPLLVPGRHFVVHGRGGPVHAVGGRKPSHIIPLEERRTAPELHEQFLDIGAADREAALARVAVGDPVTFTPDFVELSPGRRRHAGARRPRRPVRRDPRARAVRGASPAPRG